MAWIEYHQELRDHPKIKKLARMMNWDYCHALGHLGYFWLWCLQHALDGDLRRYDDEQITEAAGVEASKSKEFMEAMTTCGSGIDEGGNKVISGFIDLTPHKKVHDWFNYVGRYLELKYRTADPKRLKKIKKNYSPSKVCLKTDNLTIPNHTRPDLTKPTDSAEKPHPNIYFTFLENFGKTYNELTGFTFNQTGKHFKLIKPLIDKHTEAAVVEKVRVLGILCRDKSAWFTKDGYASFTIEVLSGKWNSIILKQTPEQEKADRLENIARKL